MASRSIEDLVAEMQPIIQDFENRLDEHFPSLFRRSCTYRSQKEHDALFMRGRFPLSVVNDAYGKVGLAPITAKENKRPVTWTHSSMHTKRMAVDYFMQREGKYCDDVKMDTDGDGEADWQEFGRIAEECGLVWGGRWKKPDRPHVQMKEV